MPIRVDLTGKTFGRLTVVSLNSTGSKTYWNCLCICGKRFVSQSYNIHTGITKSCGCLRSENTSRMKTTHGYRHHPLYEIWCNIKDRCFNENNQAYKNYGARGITICKEWENDAGAFIEWCLANGWKKGLEIDRENNDGIYEPGNCRFVTSRINAFNKRTNVLIEHNGKKCTTLELEQINGIPSNIILRRIRDYGWTIDLAILKPVRLKQEMYSTQHS